MSSKLMTTRSTGTCSGNIAELRRTLSEADAATVGAGAGRSTAAGFNTPVSAAPGTKNTEKHRKTADLNHLFHNPARVSFRRCA